MKPLSDLFPEEPGQAPNPEFEKSPLIWLAKQASTYQLSWLLAHADDAVIWGKISENGQIVLSEKDFFRLETLGECRLFGEKGEILIWRAEPGWRIRTIIEDERPEKIDENQVLWGTEIEEGNCPEGFTRIVEKSQDGLRQFVPLSVSQDDLNQYRLRLRVRHYLEKNDKTGEVCIGLSRLVSVIVLDDLALKEEGRENENS